MSTRCAIAASRMRGSTICAPRSRISNSISASGRTPKTRPSSSRRSASCGSGCSATPKTDLTRHKRARKKSRPEGAACVAQRMRRLLQRVECALADFLDGAEPGDLAILRRLQAVFLAALRPVAVIRDQRLGLRLIHLEALLHRFFLVVVALDQRLARHVVLAFDLRRIELHVIR